MSPLLLWCKADGQHIQHRHTCADAADDDCPPKGQDERRCIKTEGNRCGEDIAACSDAHSQIGDGERVREIDEIGVLAEELEDMSCRALCRKAHEECKECERGADGIKDAER